MGLRRESERVRDDALPLSHRLKALSNYISYAQPIGFHATWSYLEHKTGEPRRSERFLIPAFDLLESERRLRLQANDDYVAMRREQKSRGRRHVPLAESMPRFWHGDERTGARYVLETRLASDADWYRRFLVGRVVVAEAERAVGAAEGGRLSALELQALLDDARRTCQAPRGSHSNDDLVAWRTLGWLGQIYVFDRGAPATGVPWNFCPAARDRNE